MDRCAQCGTALAPAATGRPRRYCTRACQARAYRARKRAAPAGPPRPAALTPDRLTAAAIELADRTGLEALTMRRLATELGVPTMNLYRHVPSRDALLVAMTDAVLDRIEPPGPDLDGWRPRLEHEAREEWRLYQRHPWVLSAVATSRPPLGRGLLADTERILTGIARPGLDTRRLLSVYLAVSGLVQGIALLPAAEAAARARSDEPIEEWWRRRIDELSGLLDSGAYPHLAAHFGPEAAVVDFEALFEFALTALLDGLESSVMST